MNNKEIKVEGYTKEEINNFSDEMIDAYLFTGETIILKIGTAEILGIFQIMNNRIIIELAQIDGGGEGILPLISSLIEKFAVRRNIKEIEWIVHALNCAKPNKRLHKILELKGFIIEDVPNYCKAYHLIKYL
jgi:hypothetical protein